MADPVWAANFNAKCRKNRFELKLETFKAYGGPTCSCCGESRVEFLSMDHINGVGAVERYTSHRKGEGLYRWLKKNGWPAGFRVLCMNCNFAYGHAGYCPHEREREALKDSHSESTSQILV